MQRRGQIRRRREVARENERERERRKTERGREGGWCYLDGGRGREELFLSFRAEEEEEGSRGFDKSKCTPLEEGGAPRGDGASVQVGIRGWCVPPSTRRPYAK